MRAFSILSQGGGSSRADYLSSLSLQDRQVEVQGTFPSWTQDLLPLPYVLPLSSVLNASLTPPPLASQTHGSAVLLSISQSGNSTSSANRPSEPTSCV